MKSQRLAVFLFSVALCVLSGPSLSAQDVRVTAGSVLKYGGLSNDPSDLQQVKEYLSSLESQVAKGVIDSPGIEYIDRANLLSLLAELNLSEGFDPSSGALRGLLGRLDFLIVVESLNSTSARIRVIDVESGAVKALSDCKKPSALAGMFSSSHVDQCVSPIVEKLSKLADSRRTVKQERLRKEAADQLEVQRQLAAQQETAKRQQAEEARVHEEQERKAEEQHAADEAERERVSGLIRDLTPRYEDVTSRASAELAFWQDMKRQLQSAGRSLRPEIQSLLNGLQTKSDRCTALLKGEQPDQLPSCLDQMEKQINSLEQYK